MEAGASNEKSTALDSILTLIHTISDRLQLLSQDYRGSDHLKSELTLLHKLLLRIGYFRRTQSSLLSHFSEELRHFYLILRSEVRLVYFMAEEIARFRETLRIFQQQFFEMSTIMFDEVLDKLRGLLPEYPKNSRDDLSKLKVEFKLIKVFYLCAINWRNHQASHEFSLSQIKCRIYAEVTQFYYHLITLQDSSVNHELERAFSSFRESLLKCCEQQISELYSCMSGSLWQSNTCAWLCGELDEVFDSLLESFEEIIFWGRACDPRINQLIDPVLDIMKFLKNFFLFATLETETPWIFEGFSICCQDSVINAAILGYMCWFYRDDDQVFHELQLKCSGFVQKIRPGNVQVTPNMYIKTLIQSRKCRSSYFFMGLPNRTTFANFFGSLLDYLYELLYGSTSVFVSLDQLKVLARVVLHFQERWTSLSDTYVTDDAIDAVHETAIIIFQIYMINRKGRLANEFEVRISQLLRNPFLRMIPRGYFRTPLYLLRNDTVVGTDFGTEEIKNQLLSPSKKLGMFQKQKELDVVAMVGGTGLTKLAKMVYHDSEVINHFKIRAWCNVTKCSRKLLLIQILACILPRKSYDYAGMSEDDLAEVVYKCLKGKRYLIVLDDVYLESSWKGLNSSFPRAASQSRILLRSNSDYGQGYFSFGPASKAHSLQLMVKVGNYFKGS